jgi:AbrB family looped-hinge helix DNA binding protein
MKVVSITSTNQKGQLVIPKEMRNELGINSSVSLSLVLRDNGIYIAPIEEVITKLEKEDSYFDLLAKTKGGWGKGHSWQKARKKRKEVEIEASKKRRKKW